MNDQRALMFLVASAMISPGIGVGNIYIFHIALMLVYLYLIRTNRLYFIINKNTSALYIILFLSMLSVVWSISLAYAMQASVIFAMFVLYINAVLILQRGMAKFSSLVATVSIVLIVHLGIALFESTTGIRMPWSPFSQYAGLLGKGQTDFSYFSDTQITTLLKVPTGFFGNTNSLAVGVACLFPMAYFYATGYWRLLIALSCLAVIFTSDSRLTVLAITIQIVLVLSRSQKFKIFLIPLLTLISISPTILGLVKEYSTSFADSLDAVTEFVRYDQEISYGTSLYVRRELIETGLRGFRETYGIGVGAGNSKVYQEKEGAVLGRVTSLHNYWIEFLVEMGIVSSIIFAIFWSRIIIQLWIGFQIYKQEINLYLLISIIGFVVASASASSVTYNISYWTLVVCILSAIQHQNKSLGVK